ncbi:MAG: outer membrane beta-barrel protein [Burkholderiales bacterium]|nr:outer membrane beta-barrel protein [Burkholderiales bacterium]
MQHKHTLVALISLLLGAASGAWAAELVPAPEATTSFYGGISLRSGDGRGPGLSVGPLPSIWNRFALPVADDSGARTLAYGGYRFANDLTVEAAVATVDRYSLQPAVPGGRHGVGLALASDADTGSRAWNVDVYTSWEFKKSLSLYGRLGYAQSEAVLPYAPVFSGDAQRVRDGMSYGVGLRYDLSSALGLRLEYARFGRLPGEIVGGALPENDQLQLGVQFRF